MKDIDEYTVKPLCTVTNLWSTLTDISATPVVPPVVTPVIYFYTII